MGGSRRNRGGGGGGGSNSNSGNKQGGGGGGSIYSSSSSAAALTSRHDIVLQEIQQGLYVNWKEVAYCWVLLVVFCFLGILIGIASGTIISIHYFEKSAIARISKYHSSFHHNPNQNPSSTAAASVQYHQYQQQFWSQSSPRATLYDPLILEVNTLITQSAAAANRRKGSPLSSLPSLDLGTVVTASESGQLNVLMVVEESVPLHGQAGGTSLHGGGASGILDSSSSSQLLPSPSSSSPYDQSQYLTIDQANELVPEYSDWLHSQPLVQVRDTTVHPTTCRDGSLGFDNWNTLKDAVQEANSISAERFLKWSSYFANFAAAGGGKKYDGHEQQQLQFTAFYDDLLYYEEDVLFRICPGSTLKARKGPIFLNAENVVIECDGCTVDVGGTHLAFGPHAKNVLVKGITFRGAYSSSLTFFHDGADASFEDCYWVGNTGSSGKFGAVADVNSTSSVNFYRCEIGYGKHQTLFGGTAPGKTSSLSIRV